MQKNEKSKKKYHHENLKEVLVDTSLEILEGEGLESITLRYVTARIGTSRTSVYRHFDSKEHLLQALILRGFRKLNDVLEPILLQKEVGVIPRLRLMGKAYVGFAMENKALYRIMLGDRLSTLRETRCEDDLDYINTGFNALVSLMLEGQEKKVFIHGDSSIQASSIWAIIHGQASLLIDSHTMIEDNKEMILNETLDVVIRAYSV